MYDIPTYRDLIRWYDELVAAFIRPGSRERRFAFRYNSPISVFSVARA